MKLNDPALLIENLVSDRLINDLHEIVRNTIKLKQKFIKTK